MASLVNKTSRVIVVDGLLLVPGKAQQVKDVKKLMAKNPRLAELFEAGEVVEKEVKAVEEVKPTETEDTERPLNRRKRG